MRHTSTYVCLLAMALCQTLSAQEPSPVLEEAALRSPAVAAVLDAPREQPGDALAAAFTLLDLREFAAAGEVFREVTEANLSAAEQAALVRRFGTAKFLMLAREGTEHEIAGARAFGESALAASAAQAAKPERLTQLISDLASSDTTTREAARRDLAATGLPAAQAVLEALASSTDKTQRGHLLAALVEMSPVVDPLVIAALADGSGQFRRDVAELAGHLHLLEAVPWLATAVVHPNRRLKFAALTAIMQIHPVDSFPGASYVPEALWQVAAGAGTEQAVVGSSTVARANDWAGHLRVLGYDATPVATGVDVVQQATRSPRLALVLVDSDIGRPLLREVIFQLRSQPKLTQTPVAVLTSNFDYQLGQRLAAADRRLLAVPRPRNSEATKSVVDRLMQLVGPLLTADERTAQASRAIEWIGSLLAEGTPYDELLRDASILEQTVYDTELTEVSLRALANVGTASSQRTLVDLASQESQEMHLRQLAAESFAISRQRFGLLLSAAEIARQYDRYNASEMASAEVQELLGYVLDVLERKAPE